MRNYTYHFEIKTILLQFANALNDIIIKRYNTDKEAEDQIHVNFMRAPKSRTLWELTNKNQHFKLPIISIWPSNIRRNPARVFEKLDGANYPETFSRTTSAWWYLKQPVPVDFTVNVAIVARFQEDIDQILTNFIPYTNDYFVVSWKWPDTLPFTLEIRSHCIWDGSVNLEYPLDIQNTAPYRVIANTTFTVESWLFKNSPNPWGPIYKIDTSFTAVSDIEKFEIMRDWEETYNTDYYTDYTVISARPQFTVVRPFAVYTGAPRSFNVTGKMLDYTDRLFISGSNQSMFLSSDNLGLSGGYNYFDLFSSVSSMSAAYPGFSAVELEQNCWNIEDQYKITFSLTPTAEGWFDIVALNNAGYGIMSVDCVRPTTNPYPSAMPEYDTYVEYQHDCISGIEVREL